MVVQYSNKVVAKAQLQGKPPIPRSKHSASTLGLKMYIYGGRRETTLGDLWVADFGRNGSYYWTEVICTGSVPVPRSAGYLTNVHGKLLLLGGDGGQVARETPTKLSLYSPEEESWQTPKTTCNKLLLSELEHWQLCLVSSDTFLHLAGSKLVMKLELSELF